MIYILTGANGFGLRARLDELVQSFVQTHGDMALERLDGEEASFERIQEALQSLPFLVDKKMVVLQTPGANKQFTEQAERLLAELPESTDLIVVEPKLDKRSSYYKLLKKQKGYQEFAEMDEAGLARWLVDLAASKHASLGASDARYLIERVGANQLNLANELEKLSIYTDKITRQTIDELTVPTPQSTIFQLLETAFAGNTKRTLELYSEQRALKVDPLQIIAMLGWQLHVLALVKAAGSERTPDTIAREAKINPYVVRKTAGIARGLSFARVKELVSELTTIDERLKRESLNADDVLLNYLLQLATI